jgi:hypothetical protein
MSPSLIAPVGQTLWQVPHATQVSLITYAISHKFKINTSSKLGAKVVKYFEYSPHFRFFLKNFFPSSAKERFQCIES